MLGELVYGLDYYLSHSHDDNNIMCAYEKILVIILVLAAHPVKLPSAE